MKKFILQIIVCVILVLMSGCSEHDIITSDCRSVKYVSSLDKGCGSDHGLSKTNSNTVFDWTYLRGRLEVDLSFSTLCSAILKDSVEITDNIVNIYLADINPSSAECICPHKEVFNFFVQGKGRLRLIFSFKQYFKNEYDVVTDSTIYIE